MMIVTSGMHAKPAQRMCAHGMARARPLTREIVAAQPSVALRGVLPTSQLGKLNNWRPGEGTSGKALARNVYRYDYL